MTSLFVYGTLLVPEIMRRVVGRVPSSDVAALPGYKCRKLRGVAYPGIVPARGTTTNGRIYSGIEASELSILDSYEGDEYKRQTVLAEVPPGESMVCEVSVEVFVLRAEYANRVSEQEFVLTQFMEADYDSFLRDL